MSATGNDPSTGLPVGWATATPDEQDVAELTELLRCHEQHGRGWAGSGPDIVRVAVAGDRRTRDNLVVRDADGAVRGWAGAHDRAAGRMLLTLVVDPRLVPDRADPVADVLLRWAEETARRIGAERGLTRQQIDSGAFAADDRQHRWLERGGFERVRTWWQMTRPTAEGDAERPVETGPGVRIRRVRRQGSGMPDEDDLRAVHDVLESAFADHFNNHEETFDEFLSRLREDPGHRWDHWWVAELVGPHGAAPAGALVGSLSEGGDLPASSYVEYIGVLQSARGRGVAKSLLTTVIVDAAADGRSGVGLEVDADSPTGADGLYVSMGWRTDYVTQSWHRTVPIV